MNIVGEGFEERIRKQINIRQQLKGKRDRNPEGNPRLLLWQNGNTGWVRMVSSVDVNPEVRYASSKNTGSFENASPVYYKIGGGNTENSTGKSLALNNILVGGTKYLELKDPKSTTDFSYTETPFSGINRYPNNNFNPSDRTAYGYGGLEFGFQPMPGITSFNIKSENRGSLRTATVGVKAYNKFQFDAISTLYMSLGYSMLIEWGNTMYYDNDGKFHEDNQFTLAGEFLTAKYKWTEFLPIIKTYQLESNGNYDAALCKVVNFNWKLNKDMSYDITITLRSVGDVIEALKVNTLSNNTTTTSKTSLVNNFPKASGASTGLNTVQSGLLLPQLQLPTFQSQQQALNLFNNSFSLLPSGQPSLTTVNAANTTDIGIFLESFRDILKSQATTSTNSTSPFEIPLVNGSDVIGFKEIRSNLINASGISTPQPNYYYIRLGYFLGILETKIIPNIKQDPNLKAIPIDYDTDTNIISIDRNLISANPKSFTFNQTIDTPDGDKVYISPVGNKFTFNKGDNWYGYIMNVYVNIDWLLEKFNSLKDKDGGVILIDFLNAICTEFCLATGNFNKITTTIDYDINTIRFVDEVSLPDRDAFLKDQGLSTIPANFRMFGYYPVSGSFFTSPSLEAGMVRDLSLVTTVSPRLAHMISIGAQANGYAIGEDATALSALNRGLTDRIKEEFWYPGQTSSEPTLKTLNNQYSTIYTNFYNFVKKLGILDSALQTATSPTVSFTDDDINVFLNTNRQFIEYKQAKATLTKQKTNPKAASSRTGFLPFNLSLTLDGLSGMKIYNRFTADTEYLPSNYPDTIEFIITGISHEIKDNQWITNIDSIAIPVNPLNGDNPQTKEAPPSRGSIPKAPSNPPRLTVASTNPTPTLRQAVKDQANYFFGKFGESKLCARYAYNIAYNLKNYITTNSTKAIPQTIQYSANADQLAWRTAVNRLDFYEQVDLGYMNLTQLKAWTDSSTFNYGDILNYYAPGHSGETNMHAQIYTGDIFSLGKSYDEIKKGLTTSSRGNSGWSSSTKTNYGKKIVYDNSYTFKVFYFKVKSQYIK